VKKRVGVSAGRRGEETGRRIGVSAGEETGRRVGGGKKRIGGSAVGMRSCASAVASLDASFCRFCVTGPELP
jgi:hypothetical protein